MPVPLSVGYPMAGPAVLQPSAAAQLALYGPQRIISMCHQPDTCQVSAQSGLHIRLRWYYCSASLWLLACRVPDTPQTEAEQVSCCYVHMCCRSEADSMSLRP